METSTFVALRRNIQSLNDPDPLCKRNNKKTGKRLSSFYSKSLKRCAVGLTVTVGTRVPRFFILSNLPEGDRSGGGAGLGLGGVREKLRQKRVEEKSRTEVRLAFESPLGGCSS